MTASIRDHQKRGDYNSITDPAAFADLLTSHFRGISHDKHLRVSFGKPPAFRQQMEHNCGFEAAQRLDGNIGYLKFNMCQSRRLP